MDEAARRAQADRDAREVSRLRQRSRRATEEVDRHSRELLGDVRSEAQRNHGRSSEGAEDFILRHAGLLAIIGAVLGYKLISAGHLSARLFNGEEPKYPLGEIWGILWRLSHNPFDPNHAWEPVNTGGEIPSAPLFWSTVVVVTILHFLLIAVPLYGLHKAWRRKPDAEHGDVAWADGKEMADLMQNPKHDPAHDGRVIVGRFGTQYVAIDRLHSLLAVGPLHSGKTNALAVPTLLEWDGPAMVVSSKGHLMDQTIGWRRERGTVRVFDPASASRFDRSGWVLLDECGDWEGAITMAQHLASAAYGSAGGRIAGGDPHHIENGALWSGSVAMALAPYLYAAAVTGRSIMQAARWIVRQERDEILHILNPIDKVAADAHETSFYRHDASLTTFFHHIYDMLSVYGDPGVAASATKRDVVPENLLKGRHETLYLFAPEHDQARFQPLFAVIVRQTLAAINDHYAATGRPLRPRLLVLLDGTVSIASIQAVSQMASTGLEKGVEMVTVFDETDWTDNLRGNATATLLENHRALLVMNGSWKYHGETESLVGWPEITSQLGPEEAALFYDHRKPMRVQLRRSMDDERLRMRIEHPDKAADHDTTPATHRSPVDKTPDYALVDQTTAWRHRNRPDREDSLDAAVRPSREGLSRSRVGNVFSRNHGDDAEDEDLTEVAQARQRYRPH